MASGSGNQHGIASSSTSSQPASPSKPRRTRHARTPASLTSSAGAALSISSLYGSTSAGSSASSAVFASFGLDPFRTDPDQLFSTLSVKQVETYHHAVTQAAQQKQTDLRTLVGERYEDLLGTANTIIGMANSSTQLCERLSQLQQGIAHTGTRTPQPERRASRRLSSFDPLALADQTAARSRPSSSAGEDEQEQLYSLGASLKMIMDAPEFVWRSIEKGKTLHAAWAFMLARTVWWDLMDKSPSADKPAPPPPSVDVKAAFPFIERQWQGLVPMRKQIVQRAVHLLAEYDLGFAATADQLAAVVLLDNAKFEQTFTLVLSQRATALRRQIRRRPSSSAEAKSVSTDRRASLVAFHDNRDAPETGQTASRDVDRLERAEEKHLDTVLQSVVRGMTNTMTHLLRIYFLPAKHAGASALLSAEDPSSRSNSQQPYLVDVVQRLMQAPSMAGEDDLASPRASKRSSVLHSPQLFRNSQPGQSPAHTSPTALRNMRRRSSYGFSLPAPSASPSASRAGGDRGPAPAVLAPSKARVSTHEVLHSFPSSHLLLRFLPLSVLSFTPYVELTLLDDAKLESLAEELRLWCRKLRDELLGATAPLPNDTGEQHGEPISMLLERLTRTSSVARLRAGTIATLSRCKKVAERKVGETPTSSSHWASKALELLRDELQTLKSELDAAFHHRIESIHQASLDSCERETLQTVDNILSSYRNATDEGITSPDRKLSSLDSLFTSGSGNVRLGSDGEESNRSISAETKSGRGSSKQPALSTHSTRLTLARLNKQLQGRDVRLESVIETLQSHLSHLAAETSSYLALPDMEPSTRDAIRARLRGAVTSTMLCVLRQLDERMSSDETQGQSSTNSGGCGGAEIEPRRAFVARLASLLANSSSFRSTAAEEPDPAAEGRGDEVQLAARHLVQGALKSWRQNVQDLCLDALQISTERPEPASPDRPSESLLGALSLLSEAILRAGVAIDKGEIDSITRSVLDSLKARCAADGQRPAADLSLLDTLLLQTDEASNGMVPATAEALSRVRLLLLPLSTSARLGPSTFAKGSGGLPRPVQKVEDLTPLVKSSLPRLEALTL